LTENGGPENGGPQPLNDSSINLYTVVVPVKHHYYDL